MAIPTNHGGDSCGLASRTRQPWQKELEAPAPALRLGSRVSFLSGAARTSRLPSVLNLWLARWYPEGNK